MGSTPPQDTLYIGRSTDLLVAVPSAVQYASTALSREVREKIKANFPLTDHSYDLTLSLGRRLNKKTTPGRPDGKNILQAPMSH
jgi:hypothetical protein